MPCVPDLFPQFAAAVSALSDSEITDPRSAGGLLLDRFEVGQRVIEQIYAPFDHVNPAAKIVIVGMTPGKHQASNALKAAAIALREGKSADEAAASAKVFASFSGEPMRGNLIRMLDLIGVNRLLGIATTGSLWAEHSSMVHFTSALRYPVFVDGENWSGQPDMVRTPQLRAWLEQYTGVELATLKDAVIVPLGPKVATAMQHLAQLGQISKARILDGLPHPSGANAERIAYFLGAKAAHNCSTKTNTTALDTAREALMARVSRL